MNGRWDGLLWSLVVILLGLVLYGESADPRRLACVALIVAGIVGLKLVSPH